MKEDCNAKREVLVACIVCLLVLAIVIGIIFMKKNNKPEENKKSNEIEVEISYDGYEMSPEEIEQEEERIFEDDYTAAENLLGMIGNRKAGKTLLYSNKENEMDYSLIIYASEEDCNTKFKESSEKVNIDGKEYKLYETGIAYNDYKTELLRYMGENVFQKYFETYVKNIDGMLYITNEDRIELTISSFEKVEDYKYIVDYEENGELKDKEITVDENERKIQDINI